MVNNEDDNNHNTRNGVVIVVGIIAVIGAIFGGFVLWNNYNTDIVVVPPEPEPTPIPPIIDNNDTNTNDTTPIPPIMPLTFKEICELEPRAEVCIPPFNLTIPQQE